MRRPVAYNSQPLKISRIPRAFEYSTHLIPIQITLTFPLTDDYLNFFLKILKQYEYNKTENLGEIVRFLLRK